MLHILTFRPYSVYDNKTCTFFSKTQISMPFKICKFQFKLHVYIGCHKYYIICYITYYRTPLHLILFSVANINCTAYTIISCAIFKYLYRTLFLLLIYNFFYNHYGTNENNLCIQIFGRGLNMTQYKGHQGVYNHFIVDSLHPLLFVYIVLLSTHR